MRLSNILQDVSVLSTNCDGDIEVTGITYDSRKVQPGNLFVAISGFKQDGNSYVKAALEAGACAVLTEMAQGDTVPFIQVADARFELATVSANYFKHPAREMKMIGVTGTNGKTTITYLMKAILEDQGAKVGLIGTNQNMIGDTVLHSERTTPESCDLQGLLREMVDAGCTHAVMEVSSHSLVLGRVAEIEFELGIFTNISQDHLDFHKNMEEYIQAKALLFSQCRTGIINIDDEASEQMMTDQKCRYVTYSAKQNRGDIVAKNIRLKPTSVEFEAVGIDGIGRVELPIPGEFSVYNALAVVTAALTLEIPLFEISAALRKVSGIPGRAEVVSTNTDYTVMIDYAHSPGSLENILKTVNGFAEGRVIVVFGCGGNRDRLKRPKMGQVASEFADFVVVTSDNPRAEEPMAIIRDILPGITKNEKDFYVEPDRIAAIHYALNHAKTGDVVLLAGKGHETYQEINGVKHPMDEREIIAEYFKNK